MLCIISICRRVREVLVRVSVYRRVEVHFINFSPLTVFSLFSHRRNVASLLSSIAVFRLTALLVWLTAWLPSSCGLTPQGFLTPLIPTLSNSVTHELTSCDRHLATNADIFVDILSANGATYLVPGCSYHPL